MIYPRTNPFIKLGLAIAALGLLSAFTYPLMQEGYQQVGARVYKKAQIQMLETCIREYLRFNPAAKWNSNTPTREILNDLAAGWDRSFTGRADSFIPASESVDSLSRQYRIVFKGPQSFKIVPR